MKTAQFVFCFLLLGIVEGISANPAAAQGGVSERSILDTTVPLFQLTDQTLLDGVTALTTEPAPLAFGFERVLKQRFSDPPVISPRFSLRLENRSIGEILDALCTMDSRYTWTQDGPTINVYPRATAGDGSYVMNRKLDKLELKDVTDIEQALLAIYQQLPPPREQVAIGQAGGDISYPAQPWSAVFKEVTVRQAMNRIAGHLGPRGSWMLSGSRDFRAFAFTKIWFQNIASH